MRYVLTLTKAQRTDSDSLGFRAADLAVLKEKGFNVPLSFVVNNEAFEDFLAANGLRAKTERIILEKADPDEAYKEIMGLFVKSALPKELEQELLEAYDSLSIEPGSGANSLISGHDFPFVTVIRSPSYILPSEAEEGVLQNLKGQGQLVIGLKLIWSSMFSPDSRSYRAASGISEKFSVGVIVEKMRPETASAVAYSRTDYNEFMIRVKSFRGLQDYGEPISGKDIHEVDANSLLIRNQQIGNQEYEIARDVEKEELVKRPLLDVGSKQKVNDRVISECARIAKRAKSFIGKDLKLYLGVHKEVINILQVNRLTVSPHKQEEPTAEAGSSEDDGNRADRHDQDSSPVVAPEPKFEMPTILSEDEAKKSVMHELAHKLFSLKGFTEEAEENKVQPAIEIIQDVQKGSPEAIEKEVIHEEALLDEVLKIKGHIDKMESHAASGNKEAYEQEAKLLKSLLSRIRSED